MTVQTRHQSLSNQSLIHCCLLKQSQRYMRLPGVQQFRNKSKNRKMERKCFYMYVTQNSLYCKLLTLIHINIIPLYRRSTFATCKTTTTHVSCICTPVQCTDCTIQHTTQYNTTVQYRYSTAHGPLLM